MQPGSDGNTTLVLTFHADPGHGWIEAPKVLADALVPQGFTRFSYQKGGTYYLEEDQDAGTLIHACQQAGIRIEVQEHTTNGQSIIRSFSPLKGE